MREVAVAVLLLMAGCVTPTQDPSPEQGGPEQGEPGQGRADAAHPVLASLGVEIDAYDPSTGQAGDILFSEDLMYDDGRVHNDRPFVDFGWTHEYQEQANLEYWFYVPLHTTLHAPTSGEVTIQYLDHTDDWAIHFDAVPGWTVSFEHVVDIRVEDGQWVDAGEPVADAAPRPGFGHDLAMVELAVWQGGGSITKHCPADFLEPDQRDDHADRLARLAADWEAFIGQDIYDEDAWVAPGCLLHEIQET